jgi:hypothetical protein
VEKVLARVTNRLKDFHICFENDILDIPTTQSNVQIWIRLPSISTIILYSGIYLVFCDTFYWKKRINDEQNSDSNEDDYYFNDDGKNVSLNFDEDVSETLTKAEIFNKEQT